MLRDETLLTGDSDRGSRRVAKPECQGLPECLEGVIGDRRRRSSGKSNQILLLFLREVTQAWMELELTKGFEPPTL